MDLAVKHPTIFFCQDQTVLAQSKQRKLRYCHIASLELIQTLQQFDQKITSHQECVKNTNPEYKLLFVIATPTSAGNLINRNRLIHKSVFNRIFLLGTKAQCTQVSSEKLQIYIVTEQKSQKLLVECMRRIQMSLIKDKEKSVHWKHKPEPIPNLNTSMLNESAMSNFSHMKMSESMRNFLNIKKPNLNNTMLPNPNLSFSFAAVEFQSHSMNMIPEGGLNVTTTNIVGEIDKEETKLKKKKQQSSYSVQLDPQLWKQTNVPSTHIKKEEKSTQYTIQTNPKIEPPKIEQIIKQKIDPKALERINQKITLEKPQEVIDRSSSEKDEQNNLDDVQRSCYSIKNQHNSQIQEDNNHCEPSRVQNILEVLSEQDQKNEEQEKEEVEGNSQEKQHHSPQDSNHNPESKYLQSTKEKQQLPDLPNSQPSQKQEVEQGRGYSDRGDEQSDQKESSHEQNQSIQETEGAQKIFEPEQVEKVANPQEKAKRFEKDSISQNYRKQSEIVQEIASGEQKKVKNQEESATGQHILDSKQKLEQGPAIIINKNRQEIQKTQQQKEMMEIHKNSRQSRPRELSYLSQAKSSQQDNIKTQQNKIMSQKQKIRLAYQKLQRRVNRNARWDDKNSYTTPSKVSEKRKFLNFANKHYREQVIQVREYEPKKINSDYEFDTVSVLWADPNPNLGVTQALSKRFKDKIEIKKVPKVDYDVIQQICNNSRNQYIIICNNGCFLEFLTNKSCYSYPYNNCRNYIVYCMNDAFAYENIRRYDPYDRVSVTVDMDQCVKLAAECVEREYFKIMEAQI